MPSDAELIDNIKAGVEPGFSVLYESYCDRLYRYARLISGSRLLAEEAAQETFVYVIEHAGKFDSSRSHSAMGWLYGIMRNRIRSLSKDLEFRAISLLNAASADESPDRMYELSEATSAVVAEILKLSEEHKEVIVLCGIQEVDYLTAAEILDIPAGTVRSRLYRARQSLRNRLSKRVLPALQEVSCGRT